MKESPVAACLPLVLTAIFYSAFCIRFGCQAKEVRSEPTRVVCLGDSITDGDTYPQIIMQSLREAGSRVPAFICSGVGGDTAQMMDARFDKTVAEFQPDIVTVSASTNDALQNVSPESYGSSIRSIVAKAKTMGAKVVLLTPCECLARTGNTEAEKEESLQVIHNRLDAYEAIIRKIGAEDGCLVAENRKLMTDSLKAGNILFVEDNIHPNYLGQSLMARSILDAMGHREVALPRSFEPKSIPGLVEKWMVRLSPLDAKGVPIRLTGETVGDLAPDRTWTQLELPEDRPLANSPEIWPEQMRRNGCAMEMEALLGKGELAQGVAELTSADGGQAFVQTGMRIKSIWLNGLKIHDQNTTWTGVHPGKERIPVSLKKGVNRLIIEFGSDFFLAVTPGLVWEETHVH